ncbi:MAG TPA: ABC transporter transmembrane domain-containing protein, partial [Mycobacteriales bacterium]
MTRRDPAVKDHKLAPGTWRRILAFAGPYRRQVAVFLATVVVSSVVSVATPVLAGRVIDQIDHHGARSTVVLLASVIAGLALVDAVVQMVSRWSSSRIGEGIILDLRSRVFDHVSRMPLAFFTRTQTGALVSRLNNDVIGAQRAFTSTLSGTLSNVIALVLTLAVMLTLSWEITLLSL